MKAPIAVLSSCAAGLLAGWGSAEIFTREPHGKLETLSTSASAPPMSAPRRSTLRKAPRLATVQDCQDLLATAASDKGRHPLLGRFDRHRALRRWIELDPEGVLAEAEQNASKSFAGDLFRQWVSLDPRAALDALKRVSRDVAGAVAKDVFFALMASEPALAIAELKDERWTKGDWEFLRWGFHAEIGRLWALSDPAGAVASLGGPKPASAHDHQEFQTAILAELAKTDFASAWKHGVTETEKDESQISSNTARILAMGLLSGDPAALKILEQLPVELSTELGPVNPRGNTAQCMVEEDLDKAMAMARARPMDDPLRREILAYGADQLATCDPRLALAMLKESANVLAGWETASVLRESIATIAAENPDEALKTIAGLPPDQRKEGMSGYLTRMFAVDPGAGVAQCRVWLEDPDLKDGLPEAFTKAFSWGHGAGVRDPGPLLEAIPELNGAVNGGVLATWAKADPEAAAEWISGHAEQKKLGLKEDGVLAELSITRPEFTAGWLLTLPNAAMQIQAARTLTSNWAAFDSAAAKAWTENLPEGPLREAAEEGMTKAAGTLQKPSGPFEDPFASPGF